MAHSMETEVMEKKEIPRQLDELNSNIDTLEGLVATLFSRLETIRQIPPEGKDEKSANPMLSSMGSFLFDQNSKLQYLRSRIESLLMQLTL